MKSFLSDRTTINRQVVAWAFYDWANSAFAVVVLSGFFPLFFREYWSSGQESSDITFRLGIANALSSLVIVACAPLLGAIADQGSARKKFLFVFAMMGIVMTGCLFLVGQGQWFAAVTLFVLATIGFMGANVFYDALIIGITRHEHYDTVSALGYALGYLGGGLLFALCVMMTLYPSHFGLQGAADAVRLSFVLVATWWAVFSLPLLFWVKEPVTPEKVGLLQSARNGFRQLIDTFHHIRQLRHVLLFLLAYWLYIDGVDTIVRMAVDYGQALGFDSNQLILALLITQFIGFPSAIVFGHIGERLGTKTGIYIAIAVYICVTMWGVRMTSAWEFYVLAVAIGLVQGGIQSLSRAYYARMIPVDKAAEFFGFYNMLGKFAAVIGPFMVGWVGVLSGNPRLGMLSLLILFIGGGVLLYFVRPTTTSPQTTNHRPSR